MKYWFYIGYLHAPLSIVWKSVFLLHVRTQRKRSIINVCTGYFLKIAKSNNILSEKSICPNSKNRFSQNTNHRQSANISLPQKFRATQYVLLIQFQWNCPGDEIHVRKEEIYGHFLSVLKRNYTLNHNKLTRNSSQQLLLLYYYTHVLLVWQTEIKKY